MKSRISNRIWVPINRIHSYPKRRFQYKMIASCSSFPREFFLFLFFFYFSLCQPSLHMCTWLICLCFHLFSSLFGKVLDDSSWSVSQILCHCHIGAIFMLCFPSSWPPTFFPPFLIPFILSIFFPSYRRVLMYIFFLFDKEDSLWTKKESQDFLQVLITIDYHRQPISYLLRDNSLYRQKRDNSLYELHILFKENQLKV